MLAMKATTLEQLIPTLTMLGDTASGSADKLRRIAFAYAEVKANGRATMQEIRQFTNAGVPLLATVADMYRQVGDSTEDAMKRVRKLTKDGKLTATVMVKAFKIMTSEGGLFFRGMDKTSKDFLGRVSTLKDEITIMKQTIGLGLIPTLTKYVDEGIQIARMTAIWAQANQGLIKEEVIKWLDTGKRILKDIAPIMKTVLGIVNELLPIVRELSPLLPILAAGWLANKTALTALAVINVVPVIWGIGAAIWSAAFGTTAWNAAILLIPGGVAAMVGFVIAGLTLIGAGIFLLVKHWDTVRDALVKGAKVIFSVWSRVLFFPILQFIKGIGFLGKMIGKALGIKSIEREFGSLMQTMDDFDNKLAKIGRDAPKPFKIMENSVQRTRVKFGGLMPSQEPTLAEPGSPRFLRESIFNFGSPGQAKKLTRQDTASGTPFSVVNMSNLVKNAVGKFKREDAETGFQIPDSVVKTFAETKKTVEHVVKLVVPGTGQDQVVNLTPGSQAPPVEINLLGAN
jgi:tape measure domain-containing protein